MQGFAAPRWLDTASAPVKVAILAFSGLTAALTVAWIQLIASELVGCLQAFGIVLQCPPVLLGFALAVVNSLVDAATNLAVAKVSGKRAAFAACYSGMAFNLTAASLGGYLLYTRQTHAARLPLHISSPTWLLWSSLVAFLVATLGRLSVLPWRGGAAPLPDSIGQWCRVAFFAVLAVFLLQASAKWLLDAWRS